MKKIRQKKGIYFAIDGILASMLIIGVMVLLLHSQFYEKKTEQRNFITQDIINVLSEITLVEVNNTFIQTEISNGNITDVNKTVLEQIGEYWALNKSDKAKQLFESVYNYNSTDIKGIILSVENDIIYNQTSNQTNNLVSTSRIIAGISKGNPLTGYSSSAYLKKVHNKRSSAYAYLGGFIGQGNITTSIDLPDDFIPSRLISAELKIETPGNFKLYINDTQCGATYTGNTGVVSYWNLSSCNSSFTNNKNKIALNFTSTLNTSYVSGGFLKVVYTTDTLLENTTDGFKKYYFPQVDGFINIYDSISAQGLIRNWSLNLTFYNEYDTFLTVGNDTIFIAPGSNTTQNILYTELNVTLAPTQIPIRLGTTNLSNVTQIISGQPADSFLVTDVSGSMNDCAVYDNQTVTYCGYEYKFWWWWFYTECPYTGSCVSNECGGTTTTRNHQVFNKTGITCNATMLDIAKDADKLFVENILNQSTQHQIGLVDFATDANPATPLTNVKSVLDNEIDSYSANGWTCTCCGINKARDIVNLSENNKFIVVLSDGEPTRYCSGGLNDYTGSSEGYPYTQSTNDAISSAQEACNNNITVYAIGFGEGMSASGMDTMKQIACNESLYFNATNVSELAAIYENISQQILLQANFSSQTVEIAGNYSNSRIYNNSYIDIYYDPISTNQKGVSLKFESNQFNSCNFSEYIPQNIFIKDASVTSFSSNHWTKSVFVNDNEIFNLTTYGSDYQLLGDPFMIQVPSALLIPGAYNNISIEVGDSPDNSTNCSANNTLIYTALLKSSTSRNETLSLAIGCYWTIESENNVLTNVNIPKEYNGTNTCSYTSSNISYNPQDAYDSSSYQLFKLLDPDNNGKILVDLSSTDLEITLTTVGNIPYLWGPSLIRLQVQD